MLRLALLTAAFSLGFITSCFAYCPPTCGQGLNHGGSGGGGGGGGGDGGGTAVVDPGPARREAASQQNVQANIVWNRRDWVNAISLKKQVLATCGEYCSPQFISRIQDEIARATNFAAIVAQAHQLDAQADDVWNRRDWANAVSRKQAILQRCRPNSSVQYCTDQFTNRLSEQISRASQFVEIVAQANQLNAQANDVWNRRDWANAVSLKQAILQKCRPNSSVQYCTDQFVNQLSEQISRASKFAGIVSQATALNAQADQALSSGNRQSAIALKQQVLQNCGANTTAQYCPDGFIGHVSDQVAALQRDQSNSQANPACPFGLGNCNVTQPNADHAPPHQDTADVSSIKQLMAVVSQDQKALGEITDIVKSAQRLGGCFDNNSALCPASPNGLAVPASIGQRGFARLSEPVLAKLLSTTEGRQLVQDEIDSRQQLQQAIKDRQGVEVAYNAATTPAEKAQLSVKLVGAKTKEDQANAQANAAIEKVERKANTLLPD